MWKITVCVFILLLFANSNDTFVIMVASEISLQSTFMSVHDSQTLQLWLHMENIRRTSAKQEYSFLHWINVIVRNSAIVNTK